MSVATGSRWLERFPTIAGKVLYVDNELHRETLADRIHRVVSARSLSLDDVGAAIDVLSLRGVLTDIHGLGRLLRRIEAGTYQVVIVDALYRMLPAGVSENDNAQIAAVYNAVDAIADRLRCAVVLVHHSSRGNQATKGVTDVGSGAGSQSRATDAHLVMREHDSDGCYVLDAVVRSWPPVDSLVLRWEFPVWMTADELDPANLRRPLKRNGADQQQRDREGMDAIVKALKEHGESSTRELRARTGMGNDRAVRLAKLLRDEGRIVSRKKTLRGNETTIYSITQTDVV